MMKVAVLLVATFLIASCGKDSEKSGENASPFEGTWYYVSSIHLGGDTLTIVIGLEFSGAKYRRRFGSSSDLQGMRATDYEGDFSYTDAELTMVPERSSCSNAAPTTLPYRVVGEKLTLDYEYIKADGNMAAEPLDAEMGCPVGTDWIPGPVVDL